jgi:hypothetical protein
MLISSAELFGAYSSQELASKLSRSLPGASLELVPRAYLEKLPGAKNSLKIKA